MGRDDLKAGCYTGRFFAERNIRYIAINDGADSDKGDNNFTPLPQSVQRFPCPRYQQENPRRHAGKQTPPRQTSGTAGAVLWTIVLRRLRQQTAFCYGQEHDPGAGLLPLREVQEQYGGLYHALYPQGNAETVCAAPDIRCNRDVF